MTTRYNSQSKVYNSESKVLLFLYTVLLTDISTYGTST
jgi:hypothetical protein